MEITVHLQKEGNANVWEIKAMSVSKNMMDVKGFAQAWSTEKYLFSYFYNEDAQRWIDYPG